MTTLDPTSSPVHIGPDSTHDAYLLLRTVFTVAPIRFGLDKSAQVKTHRDTYLVPWINDLVPGRLACSSAAR